MNIEDTLNERGKRYGSYSETAAIIRDFVGAQRCGMIGKRPLAADQEHALYMIYTKIARVLNGDHDHVDQWHDIAGYATLVAQRLEEDQKCQTPSSS